MGRKPPDEVLDYELDKLDRAVLLHIASYPNDKQPQIAARFGISRIQLSKRMMRPVFKRAILELYKPAMEVLQETQKEAAKKIRELIRHEDPKIALEAARLALTPLLTQRVEVTQRQEVVYRTQIGEGGQIIQEKPQHYNANYNPKSTLELLGLEAETLPRKRTGKPAPGLKRTGIELGEDR